MLYQLQAEPLEQELPPRALESPETPCKKSDFPAGEITWKGAAEPSFPAVSDKACEGISHF